MKLWTLRNFLTGKFLQSCKEEPKQVSNVVWTEYPGMALRFDTAIEARNFNRRVFRRVGVVSLTEHKIDAGLLE